MMSEDSDITNWIEGRRDMALRVDESFSAGVMRRIRALEVRPSIGERVAATVLRFVPERRREFVYFGGSAFAGALRVSTILYFILGAF